MFSNLFKRNTAEDAAGRYIKTVRRMDRQFQRAHKGPSQAFTAGFVQQYTQIENGIIVHAERASLALVFLNPNLIEVRLRPDRNFPPPFSYALDERFPRTTLPLVVNEDSKAIVVGAGGMACVVWREDCRLQIVLSGGQDVSLDAYPGLTWSDDGSVRWSRQLPQEEWCYGLGERAWALNLRGQKLALWNTDKVHYKRGDDPIYYSIPFYLGVHPEYALGILWDNPARGVIDLGASHSNSMTFSAEGGELRFYLTAEVQPSAVLKTYFALTGAPPLPPLWAFGYHQSRWSYTPSDKFRELAREFRQRHIPCDSLHFDIDYMEGFRVFTWNKKSFADLPQLLKDLAGEGFKPVAIVDPGVKVDEQYEPFQTGRQAKVFHTYPDGELYIAPVWAEDSVFPDFTNPVTRDWWAGYIKKLAEVGFAGLWNDMNEPTVFEPKGPGTIPDYIPAHWEGHGSTHRDGAHNVYGTQMSRATREGLERAFPNKRPFVLTRAAYAGSQRYTASWTGDNSATWDHLRLTISIVLNLGLSGMFFTGPDIGGFHGAPDGELYARWLQMASFLPFCRSHTIKDSPDQEPWSYGTQVEGIVRRYLELRYQLLPYFYSTYAQSTALGLPPIRPTFLFDRTDTRLYGQDDVFMVGDALLIAPILEKGATQREVYLPRGVWYDFWTRKLIDGARTITVEAPLQTMPIFVKSGKILPMWPVMQYVGEKQVEELLLKAYAGSGETTIYEDAGEGLSYLQGDYRWSYFTCRYLPSGQFGIDWRRAGTYQPPYKRARLEITGISGEPESVVVDGQPAALWFFEKGVVEVLNEPFQAVRLVGKVGDEDAGAMTQVSRPSGN